MNKTIAILISLVFIFASFAAISQAQEDEMDNNAFDNYELAYGKVSAIDKGKIEIKEMDLETDQEVAGVYLIDETTNVDDYPSLDDVKVGDNVEILYENKDGVKTAKMIYKGEEEYEETDYTDESMTEQGNMDEGTMEETENIEYMENSDE